MKQLWWKVMARIQHSFPALRAPLFLLGALACALLGLIAAFLITSQLADRQFKHARLSEQQAAAVSRIAVLQEAQSTSASLEGELTHYRNLIEAETRLLGNDEESRQHQLHEQYDASLLSQLASDPKHRGAFHREAERISRQEAQEVEVAQRDLERTHSRNALLAAGLAVVVLVCAIGVGWLLLRQVHALEASVRDRTAQIEEIDRSRRLFFAKASHELRTPVTAICGEAEVALSNGAADVEKLRESLRHLHANAAFLGHRIDELLGLASADDGKLLLMRERIDLRAVVESAVHAAGDFAASVDVRIVCDDFAEPLEITGDVRWLRQAVLTVIENGLKFSPMRGVLEVTLSGEGSWALIAITDTGPGIMPHDLPRVFDAYYQAEAGRQRGGSGLGLALARWVVERHGGTASAENLAAGGCRVSFALPLEAST